MADSDRTADEQTRWNALVAEAAKHAASDIRDSDDPHQRELLAALDEIHARLSADADGAGG